MILCIAGLLHAFDGIADSVRVCYMEGQAMLKKRDGVAEFQPVNLNQIITTGDCLRTSDNGKISLAMAGKGVIRLAPNSEIEFFQEKMLNTENNIDCATVFHKGMAWVNSSFEAMTQGKIRILFRHGYVTSTQGVFRITRFSDGAYVIKMYQGTGTINGPLSTPVEAVATTSGPGPAKSESDADGGATPWRFQIKSYEQIIIRPDGRPTKPFRFAGKADQTDWVLWNQRQDKKGS